MNPVNLLPVAEYRSLREAFGASARRPFVVRDAEEFSATTFEAALERFSASGDEVFGYDPAGQFVEGLFLASLTQQWLDNRLDVNVLDSPMHLIDLPVVLDECAVSAPARAPDDSPFTAQVCAHEHGQSPVLTRAGTYTPFHVDPPLFGGGWMYLWRGCKTWHFVSQEWITTLYSPQENDKIRDASVEDLARVDHRIECLAVTAGAGDFLYFPPGWIHRVWTHDKSLGIGGYIQPEGAIAELCQATAQLEALGSDYFS